MSAAQLDLLLGAPWWRLLVPQVGRVQRWDWSLENSAFEGDVTVALILYVTAPDLPVVGKVTAEVQLPYWKTERTIRLIDSTWLFGAGEAPTWFFREPWRCRDGHQIHNLGSGATEMQALEAAWAVLEAAGVPRRPELWDVIPEPIPRQPPGLIQGVAWRYNAGAPMGWAA